jgi:glutathione S-transferase
MTDIILHHYDLSPFSEKIRLALGFKGLAWKSVKVEGVPPRPLLDALTGGYRRLPARVPVEGIIIAADAQEIVVARESPETGRIHIHFPRAGFETLAVAP